MSIALAERLKAELTDKYVVVQEGVPELRRFSGLTGRVKTVNMSCRALVQFDGPVDIGWYDIDPSFLQVVAAPLPKKSEAKAETKADAAPAVAKPAVGKPDGAKPSVTKPAGKSPLDAIRAAGAPKPAVTVPAAGAKVSPLDAIRKQMAAQAGSAPTAVPEAPVVAAPSAVPVAAAPAVLPVQPAAPAPSAAGRPKTTADILAAIRKQSPGK